MLLPTRCHSRSHHYSQSAAKKNGFRLLLEFETDLVGTREYRPVYGPFAARGI